MDLRDIKKQAKQAVEEVVKAAKLKKGDIFVIGCSSSEVLGEKIGTCTNVEVAVAIFDGAKEVLDEAGIYLAAQCCEHLNRALVVSRECADKYDLEQVNAIPQPNHAGGALATAAYQKFKKAVVVEDIKCKAKAGIDIGGTLIGMHIHPVVVPIRISVKKIGEAGIICARSRAKYVGGSRAVYDESLM